MPRVPDAEQTVRPAPFPNVRVQAAPTADTYGAQIGDTAARLGVHWYDQEVRSANDTAVSQADLSLANKQTELETQIRKTKGQYVLGLDQQVKQQYDAHAASLDEGLSNDAQRGMFARRRDIRWEQLNGTTQRYVTEEYGRHQDAVTNATLENVADRIRQNADNAAVIKDGIAEANRAVGAAAVRKGMIGRITPEMTKDPAFVQSYVERGLTPPTEEDLADPAAPSNTKLFTSPEYVKAQNQMVSGMHRHVIDGLLAQDNDLAATQYFEANRGRFSAQDLDAVEKTVTEGSTRGESRRQTDSILRQTGGMATAEQRRQALDLAREIPNDKVSDLAVDRLNHRFRSYDTLSAEDYTNKFMAASALLDQTWQAPGLVRDLIQVEHWQAMKPDDQHALEVKLDRLRSPIVSHEPQVWLNFQTLTTAQMAGLKQQRLLKTYLNHFDPSHYDRAINDWNAARNAAEKGEKDPKFVSALTNRERIQNKWIDSGIAKNPKKLTPEEEVWYNRFESEGDKALSALSKDAKPDAIDQVLTDLSDRLLKQKFKAPGFLWGFLDKSIPGIAVPDVKDQNAVRIPLKEIPEDRQNALKGALGKAGLPVTTENIEALEAKSRLRKR